MTTPPVVGESAPDFSITTGAGETVTLSQFGGDRVVLIFLRHLGCPICKYEIAQLRQRFGEFEQAGAQVIVFVDSPDDSVREFAGREDVRFHLVADPDQIQYRAYGVDRGSILRFATPAVLWKAARASMQGHLHGRFEGSECQLPGDFVVDEGGKVVYAHIGKDISDNSPLDVLLKHCRL